MLKKILDRIFPPPEPLAIGGWYVCYTTNPWDDRWIVEILDLREGWVKFKSIELGGSRVDIDPNTMVEGWFRKIFKERIK